MFTTPRKHKSIDAEEHNNSPRQKSLTNINANTPPTPTSSHTTIVFENGTMFGNISKNVTTTTTMAKANNVKLSGTSTNPTTTIVPETMISAGCSSNSLNHSLSEIAPTNEESAIESTALLEAATTTPSSVTRDCSDEPAISQDEFDQFILNRTTSESNILDSSIYSELHFPPSLHEGSIVAINTNSSSAGAVVGGSGSGGGGGGGGGGGYVSGSGGPTAAPPQTPPNARQTKRTKRKHKAKSKCSASAATLAAASQRASPTNYPPRYTAIFMDAHHHAGQYGNIVTTSQHHSGGGAANALGQIASAAVSSSYLNAPVATDTSAYMQQFQYFQQRPMVATMAPMAGHHRHHRSLFDGATTTAGIENPLNLHTTPATAASVTAGAGGGGGGITPPLRLSFRKWFSRPSLPFVIGILALGGVACTLGGIVLGSTGLIEHSTQYLSAALLMIGIGVSLLVISGAIWRLSLPDDVDECPCYRHMEMCRNCNSPYCNSRLMGGNYLYPEFQHRPPPPSYLTSLNECAGMSFMFHPTATAHQAAYSALRVNTPPPLYRSTNSLSIYSSAPTAAQHHSSAAATTIVPNLTSSIVPDHSVITMSTVMENLQSQAQPLIKEFNYLDLD